MESVGRALERSVEDQGDSMGYVGRVSHVQTVTGVLAAHTLLSSVIVRKLVCQVQTSGCEHWACAPSGHPYVVLNNSKCHNNQGAIE